ncbi:hypothetical protein [Paenibacillus sp. LHD-38]|uniref:hypothetical protein n=1 Tax=Paenibacillus sp. LHD-38 TaxID=3072143 RepID=UPI00280EB594|nr:hypothetical protein [Paenibacillus sp. LHD-38]MDQ8737192.1 hypothetical protein [Paenibacillus sp. LHD-38]
MVKSSTYHKEKPMKWQTDISKLDNGHYDEEEIRGHARMARNLSFTMKVKIQQKVDLKSDIVITAV